MVTQEKDSEFLQGRATRAARAQQPVFSLQPPAVRFRVFCSQWCDIDAPALATAEVDRSVTRELLMMLVHDCREPGRSFCNDRHSIYHRSRGAVSRFPADSSPRLARSTVHRRIVG